MHALLKVKSQPIKYERKRRKIEAILPEIDDKGDEKNEGDDEDEIDDGPMMTMTI